MIKRDFRSGMGLGEEILKRPLEYSIMEIEQTIFKCQKCGHCCVDINGVAVGDIDISRMAKATGHGRTWFRNNMLEANPKSGGEPFIRGTKTNRRCPFYNNGCSIYDSRPIVCRAYPLLNSEGGEMRPHFYFDCPGTVDLAMEIQAIKLAGQDEIFKTFDGMLIANMLRIQAHLKIIDLFNIKEEKRRFKSLYKIFRFKDTEESNAAYREMGLKFLASNISIDALEKGLIDLERGKF